MNAPAPTPTQELTAPQTPVATEGRGARKLLNGYRAKGVDQAESVVRDLFAAAGVEINGSAPSDIVVHDRRFYPRLLRDSDLGFGESYMEGWWDCEELDTLIEKVLRADLHRIIHGSWKLRLRALKAVLFNLQSQDRATKSAQDHYDIGNDLYTRMLDPRMQYTCAYYKTREMSLAEAQEAKLDMVCRKLKLEPGMRMLELGCGFGGLAKFAAENYGVKVTAVNVSKAQLELARELAGDLPIEFKQMDYRKATGVYDAVVSIGMMEHVGHKNHRNMMEVINRSMTHDAIALVHTIGNNETRVRGDAFIDKYIFPNANAPSLVQFTKAIEGLLLPEDVHNIGEHYNPTLLAWCKNFEETYEDLDHSVYDKRFYRMWRYYLLAAAGATLARYGELWQVVMTKPGRRQPDGVRVS